MLSNILRAWLRKQKHARRARAQPLHRTTRLRVEPLEDRLLLTNFPVTTTADSGPGSLRAELALAEASSGDTVTFNISGSGVHIIHFTSADPTYTYTALPVFNFPVTIDGTTQLGYSGSPVIQIDGSMISGSFIDGLYVGAGGCTIKGVDITGFSGTGIVLDTGGSNTIENNYIGADTTGATADGNAGGGIAVYGSPSNQIIENVVSGNSFTGGSPNGQAAIYIANAGANGNVIAGNFVGTNSTATAALANGGAGAFVAGGAQNTRIGASGSNAVSDAAARNIISGNSYNGVVILGTSSGANTTGTIVAGNYIGIAAAGTALPNGSDGVVIEGGAQSNRVGVNGSDADAAGEKNVISGNIGVGITLEGPGTSSNIVAGNFIGTNVAGTAALPNYYGGIDFFSGASSNRIGFDGASSAAVAALERNVISGNGSISGEAGIYITNAGTNTNVIAGNYIGVDATGAAAMPNSGAGIFIDSGAENNRIGTDGNGTADALEANVISGNTYEGVVIRGVSTGTNTTGNIVAGNFIGSNAAGTAAVANQANGVSIIGGAQSNRIGTNGSDADAAGEGNIIGGNARNGVSIYDTGSNSNTVAGNWIGTNKTATTSLPNGENGVDIANGAQNNQVGGGTALANVIEFNTQAAIAVTDAGTTGNTIRFNKIYSNGFGIDLGGTGVQTNHSGTTTGPNNLQNYPLITGGTPGSTTLIQGTLSAAASTAYTLDFYASAKPDVTFYGQAQRYLGSMSVTTNGSGAVNFTASLSAATSAGDWVTVTATDPSGNTSEFAGDRQLPYTSSALSTSTWTQLGPFATAQSPEFSGPVMAGRIETAAPDPTNANVMYLAADGGGVWKTTDWLSASPTWTPLTDSQSSTVTGSGDYEFKSLVVCPSNPLIIYAAAAGPGGGVLKSTDAGASWVMMGTSVFDQVAFGSLIVNPTNASVLYVTVLYGPNSNSGGVYKSTDGGATWTNTTASIHSGWASDVLDGPNELVNPLCRSDARFQYGHEWPLQDDERRHFVDQACWRHGDRHGRWLQHPRCRRPDFRLDALRDGI